VIETYRGAVFPWECDWNGHMNVRFYVAKFDEGTWNFLAALGCGRAEMERRNLGSMAVRQVIDYRRELHAADTVAVRSSIVAIGTSSFRIKHVMTEITGGEVAAEMELTGVFVDRARRKAVPLWRELRDRAERLREPATA
jgi:acyl-CoA thioester hydrolase